VESGSLVGQNFKKYVEDIEVGSGSHDDICVDMPSLKDVHESDDLLQKRTSCLLKIQSFRRIISS